MALEVQAASFFCNCWVLQPIHCPVGAELENEEGVREKGFNVDAVRGK
jgi:hypothetical protein